MSATTPCKVCGKPSPFPDGGLGQVECTNCWEVEKRLTAYLKSENGRRFALNLLLSDDLANAIIDMDNHGWSEVLGPDTPERMAEWTALLRTAEAKAGLLADETKYRLTDDDV